MKKIVVLLILCVFALFSCGYHTGVIQKSGAAYLQFLGNWESNEISIQIDDGPSFKLGPQDKATLFETTPGKHTVKVTRGDKTVVDRVVFLESQATFEVKIP